MRSTSLARKQASAGAFLWGVEEELLTVDEIRQALGVSYPTAYRVARRTGFVRRHGRMMVTAAAFARYRDHRETGAPLVDVDDGVPLTDDECGTVRRYRQGCRCAPCTVAVRARNRGYRDGRSDSAAEESKAAVRWAGIKRRYGLTQSQFEAMLCAQGNCCAICRSPLTDGKRVHVDHDHRTDRVRGLLCIGCNSGLGKLGDSKDGLERAWRYLDAAARAKPRRADTRRQQRRAEDQTWDWSI